MNEIWVAKDKVNENWWRYQPETTLTPLKKIISSVIISSCSHISIGLEHVYVRISSFTPKVQTDEFLLGSNPRTLKIKTAAKIHEDCNVNEAWWGGGGECVLSMWRHRVEDPICDDTLTWEVWFESELKFCNANVYQTQPVLVLHIKYAHIHTYVIYFFLLNSVMICVPMHFYYPVFHFLEKGHIWLTFISNSTQRTTQFLTKMWSHEWPVKTCTTHTVTGRFYWFFRVFVWDIFNK